VRHQYFLHGPARRRLLPNSLPEKELREEVMETIKVASVPGGFRVKTLGTKQLAELFGPTSSTWAQRRELPAACRLMFLALVVVAAQVVRLNGRCRRRRIAAV
jgi:hypothetical protein